MSNGQSVTWNDKKWNKPNGPLNTRNTSQMAPYSLCSASLANRVPFGTYTLGEFSSEKLSSEAWFLVVFQGAPSDFSVENVCFCFCYFLLN